MRAPALYPDWHSESARRHQIRGAAIAKARSEYNDERKAWASKFPTDTSGYLITDERFPDFRPPTWNEIVAKGWNVELDRLAT